MAERSINDMASNLDAQLDASGVAPAVPTLNPAPAPADPARGYAGAGAPLPGGENAQAGAAPPTPPGPAKPAGTIPASPSGAPAPPTPPGPAYDISTSRATGSSGLSADAQKRAGARLDEVGRQQSAATDAEAQARQARADYEVRATDEALSAAGDQRRKIAAEAAINDHITGEVDRKMQAGADWQPDRARIFSGSTGAARGILAAVSVITGGWMQGRGMTSTNQFLPLVYKMIDDDVADQVRSNSANIQFLREQKGDLKAAGLELKKRMLQNADAMIQAKVAAGAAKDPSVQAALESYRAGSAAKQAEWDADQRKSLERTTTEQVTRQSTPRDPNAGLQPAKPRSEDQAKATAAQDAINNFGDKAGLKRDKAGNWIVGDGALPPGAVEKINPFADDSIKAAGEAAVEGFGRLMSGGVIGPEERVGFGDQLGINTLTRAQLAARLNASEVLLRARQREVDVATQDARTRIPDRYR